MATEMNQSVRTIRSVFVLIALPIALITLFSHMGALQLPCDEYCARIRDWSLSPVISVFSLSGLLTIAFSLKNKDERLFRNLTLVGLMFAVSLQAIAISWQGVCSLCMGLAFILLGLAITVIQKVASSYAAMLPVIFGLVVIFDDFASPSAKEPERIAFRTYESPPGEREHGYIVYLDPEDNNSRLLIANTNEYARPDIKIYYRWRLNPTSKERSMRSVIAIETVSSKKPDVASSFRRAVLTMSAQRTDQNIVEVARKFDSADIVTDALKSQTPHIAALVEADHSEASRHNLDEFPALLVMLHDGSHRANPASTELLVNMGDPNHLQNATSPTRR